MQTLDLALLTQNRVAMLTGHERGVQARDFFHLDDLEQQDEELIIVAPADHDTITPSFVQGFLARSVHRLGSDCIYRKYNLGQLPQTLRDDIEIGVKRILLREKALKN